MKTTIQFFVCTAVLLGLCLAAPLPSAQGASLHAGYADVDIAPPLGVFMPGYFADRRAEGVLDPLRAKALVLSQGETQLAIVAVDLLWVPRDLVLQIGEAVQKKAGIEPHALFLHATHTHTGADPNAIAERLCDAVSDAVQRAKAGLTAIAEPAYGHAEEDSVAFIRRFLMKDGTVRTNPGRSNPDVVRPIGAIDPTLHTVVFPEAKTLLVSYGLHLDCMGGILYSADYPHHLTQGVKEQLGPEWNVLYLNACCGNVNHIDVNNPTQRSSYEESRRIGRVLADATVQAYRAATPLAVDSIAIAKETVMCPVRSVPSDWVEWAKSETVKDATAAAVRRFNEETPEKILELEARKGESDPADITALRLGSLGIVGLPAEVFVEVARDVQTHSLPAPTLVIGLTGGSMGYLPHHRGYQEGGYEATFGSARYADSTPEHWAATAARLLNGL